MNKTKYLLPFLFLFISCSQEESNTNTSEEKNTQNKTKEDTTKTVVKDTVTDPSKNSYISIEPIQPFNAWDKIETSIDPAFVNGIIVELTEQYSPYLFEEDESVESLRNNYHFVHLNGDSLADVIFVGWSGGEPMKTEIFFQTTLGEFKFIGRYYQEPYHIKIKENKVEKFLIIDNGCCGTPYGKMLTLHFNGSDFEASHDSIFPFYTSDLGIPLKKKRYLSFDKKQVLRRGPEEDDTSNMGPHGNIGNQLGTLAPNVKLTSIAKKQDYKGLVWYKVVTEPTNKIDRKLFYDSDTIPSKYVGWVLKKMY